MHDDAFKLHGQRRRRELMLGGDTNKPELTECRRLSANAQTQTASFLPLALQKGQKVHKKEKVTSFLLNTNYIVLCVFFF